LGATVSNRSDNGGIITINVPVNATGGAAGISVGQRPTGCNVRNGKP